jgi:hypothetical protein
MPRLLEKMAAAGQHHMRRAAAGQQHPRGMRPGGWWLG